MKKTLKFGLIGAGYMGKAYAIALGAVPAVYNPSVKPVADLLATSNADGARAKAEAFGFARSTGHWKDVVSDPEIGAVGICTPTYEHKTMALAALAAGKPVLCEKPLALNAKDAHAMAKAAEAAGVKTLVGYNYIKNPATQLAKQIIDSGEIGEVVHFRGTHNEDFLMDPAWAINWRLKVATGGEAGALGDMASHLVNLAHYLCGPIAEVVGETQIVIPQRPGTDGKLEAVENDDQANFLVKFQSGVLGSFETSRIAAGRKMGLTYEVVGTKGAVFFDQERMAELQFYSATDAAGRSGFKTLLVGPAHPEYGAFCVGAGHGFGYNDMITVELKDFIEGIAAGAPLWPSFRDAVHTSLVVDAVLRSHKERRWVSIKEMEKELEA